MENILILIAVVIILCILADKFSNRFGMPALILFMFLGMLFGSDGIFKIPFDNYELAKKSCIIALAFIMFYGGFNTKWSAAKSVAVKATLLSTAGVLITTGFTAVFCHIILKISFAESFAIGAVLGSTDAASVFSILRKKKLNLRDKTASILEIESGSNDPISYVLTLVAIYILRGDSMAKIPQIILMQIIFGILFGIVVSLAAIHIMTKTKIVPQGLDTIFMVAITLFSFALPELMGGNGFLSVYITGIIIGNSPIKNKDIVIPFFDGVTTLAQILIFFLLGLLSFPHKLSKVMAVAIFITLFVSFVARPIAVFILLKPLKCSFNQCLLITWAGLRGAASIVFSIVIIASGINVDMDIFHIVFMTAIFSVLVQGSMLPWVSKKLNMIDNEVDVYKTFNDYKEESGIALMRIYIPKGHSWENKTISEINMPLGSLVIMIKRNHMTVVPNGNTIIKEDDTLILSVPQYDSTENINLKEINIDKDNVWADKTIAELNLPDNQLIAMIKRGEENIIPSGKTELKDGDIVVTLSEEWV